MRRCNAGHGPHPTRPSGNDPAPRVEDLLRAMTTDQDWSNARCRDETGGVTGLFFSDRVPDIGRAKEICASCPLIEACLDAAIARREPWGVWGGQLFADGVILAQKRGRGRPRKHPRPGVGLPA